LRSASDGFKDLRGSLLDGGGGPSSNYIHTFVVAAASQVVVGVPDFARGPDSNHAVNMPNNQKMSKGRQGHRLPPDEQANLPGRLQGA
jgi:hypothetical protein